MPKKQPRVYAWESAWADWNRQTCDFDDARRLVGRACKLYGVKRPVVVPSPRGKMSYSLKEPGCSRALIALIPSQTNPAVALHEAAHAICDTLFPAEVLFHHSAEWLGIYLYLLEHFEVAPRSALVASARAFGLRWRTIKPRQSAASAGPTKPSAAKCCSLARKELRKFARSPATQGSSRAASSTSRAH